MKRWARRIGDAVPLTRAGAMWTVTALFTAWYGRRHLDLVLEVCGFGTLAIVCGGVVNVVIATWFGRRRLSRPHGPAAPIMADCEVRARTGFRPMVRRWPWIHLGVEWCDPPEVVLECGKEEEVTARRRCSVDSLERRFEFRDPFGLAAIAIRIREARTVQFMPNRGKLEAMPVLKALAGGDDWPHPQGGQRGDRADMRAYVPGDSLRHLLWNTYARTGELTVRTEERALSPTRRVFAHLQSGADDEAAAAAARVAIETGALGREFTFGADGHEGLCRDPESALRAVARSSSGSPLTLKILLRAAERTPGAQVVLFVPAREGPWLDRVEAWLPKARLEVAAFVCLDAHPRDAPETPRFWRRLLFKDARARGFSRRDLEITLLRLSRLRLRTTVLDRQTGQVFAGKALLFGKGTMSTERDAA